jgi:hypothetical protein
MDSMPLLHRLANGFMLTFSATRRRGPSRPRRWIASPSPSPPNCPYIALSPQDRSVDLLFGLALRQNEIFMRAFSMVPICAGYKYYEDFFSRQKSKRVDRYVDPLVYTIAAGCERTVDEKQEYVHLGV